MKFLKSDDTLINVKEIKIIHPSSDNVVIEFYQSNMRFILPDPQSWISQEIFRFIECDESAHYLDLDALVRKMQKELRTS